MISRAAPRRAAPRAARPPDDLEATQKNAEAEELRRARQELIIGEELYERMLTQKGQELTATTRYLKRLEQSWQRRTGERTGIHLGPEEENAARANSLLEELGDLTNPEEGE